MVAFDSHTPVLQPEAIAALNIKADGTYVDATLGRAGHSQAIAACLSENGQLIAIDRDPHAVEYGRRVFADDERVKVLHGEFVRLSVLLESFVHQQGIDGILMDLGVSSPQLDQPQRGFSFLRNGKLDMRMDMSAGESAADWLAQVDEADLVKVLFEFGEERFARRIANAIVLQRQHKPITTTQQLADIVLQSVPVKDRKKHPATKTFQAIRIQVNQELAQLDSALPQAVQLLNEGGRLAVISFHSLEDRRVKRFMRKYATAQLPPKQIPVNAADYHCALKIIGKAIKPATREVGDNPRARSAVLRVAERTAHPWPEQSYAK